MIGVAFLALLIGGIMGCWIASKVHNVNGFEILLRSIKDMKNSNLVGVYVGDTGHFDACTKGLEYTLEPWSEDQYKINCNDNNAVSYLSKSKFIVKERV